MSEASARFPLDMDAAIVASVQARLTALAARENVVIGHAVESGSRAWGFPSPDSDYDCRFIYWRRLSDYAGLHTFRDVIEEPADPLYDIGGWDLRKALHLLLKGNAVVVEWLTSPVHYRSHAPFREALLALAADIAPRDAIRRHYFHLGLAQLKLLHDLHGPVKLKKLLYALRPAVALRWMAMHPHAAIAPMNFHALCEQSDMPPSLLAEIGALLAAKAASAEMGEGIAPPGVRAFVLNSFSPEAAVPDGASPDKAIYLEKANQFFWFWINAPALQSSP